MRALDGLRAFVLMAVAAGCVAPTESPPVGIELASIGRDGAMLEVDGHAARRDVGGAVHITRASGVTEWWRTLPSGLEHGVTIEARPSGSGELVLEMAVTNARPETDGDDVALFRGGERVASYAGLLVLDARGREVPSHMAAAGDRIRIEVDDHDASYPLVVDPVFTTSLEARLAPGGDARSMALSGDGTRLAVSLSMTTVRMYRRDATLWSMEADLTGPDAFGAALALDQTGSRLLVGAPTNAAGGSGRVWIRTGTTWAEEAGLTSGHTPGDQRGAAVALDATGTRALVGAPAAGVARVSVRGAGWASESGLVPTDATAGTSFGVSVSLDASGSLAIVGAPGFDGGATNAGRAYVFTRTGSVWTQLLRLQPAADAADGEFGYQVVCSGDASTLLVSVKAPMWEVYVFERSGDTYVEAARISGGRTFGSSIDLSNDGWTAVVGMPEEISGGGTFAFYARTTAGEWRASVPLRGRVLPDRFGLPVAVSADGSRGVARGAEGVHVYGAVRGLDNGQACTAPADCMTDVCVEGVCCDGACGDGDTSDCRSCLGALTGTSDGTCAPVVAGTTCRPSADECDASDVCDGTATECPPDALDPPGTPCRSVAGGCDAEEVCTGSASACPVDDFLDGTECRPAAGECDLAEVCAGSGPTCPPDGRVSAGIACRVATNPSCDPVEACDGTATSCPADVTMCGGSDGGVTTDAGGVGVDAGAPPMASSGCGCRVAPRGRGRLGLFFFAALAVTALSVRARRRG